VCHFIDQRIDELEFRERRPTRIIPPPCRLWLHPDCKGFREVLGRMTLCIPVAEVQYVLSTCRSRCITCGIRFRRRTEHRPPIGMPSQSIRSIERMTGFVPQNAQAPQTIAAFDFAHHAALELP